jgi:hypothetical protein
MGNYQGPPHRKLGENIENVRKTEAEKLESLTEKLESLKLKTRGTNRPK